MSTFKINKGVVDNLESSLSGKSSTDLDNLSQTGEAHFANSALSNSPYTTNRILEIPQDIKLELNNGTLTLKAGSKVYVPNGFEADGTTPKFDAYTFTNDIQHTNSHNNIDLLCVIPNKTSMFALPAQANCFSGPTVPSGSYTYAYWYDTATNLIKNTNNGGTTWTPGYSLPVCIATGNSSSTFASIDQIFNGFGYIGSTVFIIKDGIKVQMPNGRNSDGSCQSSIVSHSGVVTQTYTNTTAYVLFDVFISEGDTWCLRSPAGTTLYYDSERNLMIDSGLPTNRFIIGNAFFKGGRCDSITPLATESLANSNASNFTKSGKSYLSGLGIPTHINGSLVSNSAASETNFVAPCNGVFKLNGLTTSAGKGYCQFYNVTQYNATSGQVFMQYGGGFNAASSGQFYRAVGAVKKGDAIRIQYSSNVAIGGQGYGEGLFFLPFEGEN